MQTLILQRRPLIVAQACNPNTLGLLEPRSSRAPKQQSEALSKTQTFQKKLAEHSDMSL